jgi:hypothetical protein
MKKKEQCLKLLKKYDLLYIMYIFIFLLLIINQLDALNCPENKWACNNGIQCINITSKCDSIIDCSDGSDEGTTTCSIIFLNTFKYFQYINYLIFNLSRFNV